MPSGLPVQFRPTIGYAFEQLTVTNAVKSLSASKYKALSGFEAACSALLTNEGAPIRYTYDGTTPSATVGHLLEDGGSLILNGQNQMSQFQAFRSASTDSVITVTYERE